MNIECDGNTLNELESVFRFNDAVLRHLTIRRQDAIIEQSEMLKAKEEKDRSSREHEDRRRARTSDKANEPEKKTVADDVEAVSEKEDLATPTGTAKVEEDTNNQEVGE